MPETMITVRKVSRSFGKHHVLREVSIDVHAGQIVGLLGPSGAGKTTLVRLIAGSDVPGSGEVVVIGHRMPTLDALDQIGYMAQSDALYGELPGRQNMEFFGALAGLDGERLEKRIAEAADLVDLAAHLDKPVALYSGGMKRRLSLATALLHEPKVLILDEPTVGIDPALRKSVWAKLRIYADAGASILVTTHVMDEAERCDIVCLLRDGKILASDHPEKLKEKAGVKTMEEAFLKLGHGAGGAA